MNKFARFATVALVGVAAIGFVAGASAQDKEAIVKERVATMKQQGADLKYIGDFLKGVGGDLENAGYKVQDLQFINGKLLALFVPGTSSTDMPGKSNAKPEIWTDWDKFKAIVPVLADAEQKLADAVKSGDKAAIGAALGNTGKNGCGACHSQFREKLPQ
jgi:cytochrome c556